MPSAKDRRSPRVQVSLDVYLQTIDGDVPFKTLDASYDGVYLVSNQTLPLRKLIRFRTLIPESDEELQMLGLVAHTVSPMEADESPVPPGMGIQLFSLGQETRDRWRQYVDELYEANPEARQAVEFARRAKVRIRIPNEHYLRRFRTIDLPSGSIFLHTPDLQPPGTLVDCVINHPDKDEHFIIPARVTKAIEGSIKERGLRLEFSLPDDVSLLEHFLGGAIGTTKETME